MALLLFAIVLMAFAALFFYKIMPDNRGDLNERGHKVLTQQVQNFLRKDQDLHNIIENANKHFPDLVAKNPPYDRLSANIHYDTTTNLPPDFHRHLLKTDTGVWLIVHHRDAETGATTQGVHDTSGAKRIYLTVKFKDFADPLFAGRNEVFRNYLILLDSADSTGTGEVSPTGLSLLYQQLPLSTSARLNADTTRTLAPNSDESGTFNLSMAGQSYVAFFSRFEFHWHHLVLVGLIDKNAYDRQVNATPPLFLPMIIILICLALITLPFLKVFLLSPHESINSGDVLKMALSFYVGGVVITIVVFYFFLNYVTGIALGTRLKHFSRLVRSDVEQEIGAANYQLKTYDSLVRARSVYDTALIHRLAKDTLLVDSLQSRVDSLCIPDTNLLVSRLLWLDTTGRTIAKWSPYKYPTPFTHLQNYVFYQLLINKPAAYDGVAGVNEPVLYPGKSNLTAEFQTFIARQSRTMWPKTHASFIVMADMLRASLQPVIPPGFGFSIIDNNGNILVDGDSRKSLEGNLFEESEQNTSLLEAVRYDKSDWLFPLGIRGVAYYARVTPIAGQPLHLVCYYSRDITLRNVNRLMHFSIHTLVLLWCLLGICLLLSSFQQWKPVILKFNFEKIEWIRPASNNKTNLPAISQWMVWLAGDAVGWFVGVVLLSVTLAPLFYLSLLFPFYVVLGVQIFHEWKGKYYSWIAILVLNAVIIWLIAASTANWWEVVPVIGFQALALWGLRQPRWVPWLRAFRLTRLRGFWQQNEYFGVLYLSILLISILPTLGILTYAFYAEKVQYKKEKQDVISAAFTKRSNYLLTNLIPSYRGSVQRSLDSAHRDKLLFNSSIYLTDKDIIRPVKEASPAAGISTPAGDAAPMAPPKRLPDALYDKLMDDFYFAPFIWGDQATIPDGGQSGHGMYSLSGNTVQYAPGRLLDDLELGAKSIVISSHLQKPHADLLAILMPVGLCVLLVLAALSFLAGKLVRGAIHHLFLIEIVGNASRFVPSQTEVAKMIAEHQPPPGGSWMPEVNALGRIGLKSLRFEHSFDGWPQGSIQPAPALQTDFILAMADYLKPVYAHIFWKLLDSDEERYVLYDFAIDRYTNYKNSAVLYRLIAKGVLVAEDEYLDVFSLSFRQFVLSLPEGEYADKMVEIQKKYQIPGTWQSIRIPAIAILLIMGVFLFTTQPQISTFLAGLAVVATSLTTVLAFVRSSFSGTSKKDG